MDGISESNRLSAMGQLPTTTAKKKKVPEDEKADDCDSIGSKGGFKKADDSDSSLSTIVSRSSVGHGKKKSSVVLDSSDDDDSSVQEIPNPKKRKVASVEGSTQEDMNALKVQIANLHDHMANGIPSDPERCNKATLTQTNIWELKDEIVDLRKKIVCAGARAPVSAPRPAPMSENRKEVLRLRGIVDSLSKCLEFQELYAGSLENDLDNDVRKLKNELIA